MARLKMMFLRGAVPPKNENPEKLLYNRLDECEDMWTHLFHEILVQTDAVGTLVYAKGERQVDSGRMAEVWTPDLDIYRPPYEPDILFCRGGFPYYERFLDRFPRSYKVYYGAGRRFWPPKNQKRYDLILCDTPEQRDIIRKRGVRAELFIKPAAPLFESKRRQKEYDVCFMANASNAKIKGHGMFIRALGGTNITALSLGNKNRQLVRLAKQKQAQITWGGWHLRKNLPGMISSCRIGVCCSNTVDSCPRIIPEYLACDLPVLVLNHVNFWKKKYITPQTGRLVKPANLVAGIEKMLDRLETYRAGEYYREHLSVSRAADRIIRLIDKSGRIAF